MSADDLSSQELPLSQETFLYGWQNIPTMVRQVICSDSFNNALNPEVPSAIMEDANFPVEIIPAVEQSSLPSTTDFPGFFNFTVTVPVTEAASKASAYICSSALKRLYVRRDYPCPFNFSANSQIAESIEPSYVRATIYYSSPENIKDAVNRCVNHSLPDSQKGDVLFEHLLRSENRYAEYFKDLLTNRCSVVVPFENPPAGQDFSTYVYRFLCFTSCAGGPNRRPMCIVFTLENKNLIMGRRKIDVRVCSCPFRDKSLDENRLTKRNAREDPMQQMSSSVRDMPASSDSSLSDITNDCKLVARPSKRKKDDDSSGSGQKEFIIRLRDEECYKFLKGMKTWFVLMKNCKSLNSNWVPTATDVKNLMDVLTSSDETDGK